MQIFTKFCDTQGCKNTIPESHMYCVPCMEGIRVSLQRKVTHDHVSCTQSPQPLNNKYINTPSYYNSDIGDLYDMFIHQYGLEPWLRHVEMEAVQYLVRAHLKGSYRGDVAKAKVILERVIAELDKAQVVCNTRETK